MRCSVSQILEWYSTGETDLRGNSLVTSTVALPPHWTEQDSNSVGTPAGIGCLGRGFVAAIVLESRTNPMPWIGSASHPNLSDALSEAISQAIHLKASGELTVPKLIQRNSPHF
jgi:hypothetical protein